jgi:hypothetical protein
MTGNQIVNPRNVNAKLFAIMRRDDPLCRKVCLHCPYVCADREFRYYVAREHPIR